MMLEFPDKFFEEEIRDGFKVSSMMKRAWAAELKVLKALEDFFKKYQITYYIEYGTLLGAVRHRGFIPWDDDIDIAMLRSDFIKLVTHADEIPEPFRILSIYNSDSYYMHNCLGSNNRASILTWDDKRVKEFFGCPYIVNIDINPLDYIPREKDLLELQQLLYHLGYSLTYQIVDIQAKQERGEDPGEAAYEQFEKEYLLFSDYLKQFFGDSIAIDEDRPIRNELCRVCDRIASICKAEDSDYLDYYPHMVYSTQEPFRKKEWYDGRVVELPFETTVLSASADYMEQIVAFYGKDWKNPVRGAQSHEYPFYKKQEEYFRFLGYMC